MTLTDALREAATVLDNFAEAYEADGIVLVQVGWLPGTGDYEGIMVDNQRRIVVKVKFTDDGSEVRHGLPLRPNDG